jgi:hypothetical protein
MAEKKSTSDGNDNAKTATATATAQPDAAPKPASVTDSTSGDPPTPDKPGTPASKKPGEGPSPSSSSASSSSESNSTSLVDAADDHDYPEGGFRAWSVVFGCWLALFASLGLMNILATFQTYLSTNQLVNYDDGTIGWIFSVYTFLSFFLGIYIGPIFDKYGPRWLVLAGTLCLVLSLMLLSISYGEWAGSNALEP